MHTPPDPTLQLVVVLLGALLALAVIVPAYRQAAVPVRWLCLALAIAAIAAYSVLGRNLTMRAASTAALARAIPTTALRDEGFVTSSSCRACHPQHYRTWHDSFHRTMTQPATPRTIIAPLAGARLANRGRTYAIDRVGDEFWVDMVDPDWEHQQLARGVHPNQVPDPPRTRKRIVMTTGSHHQQTYWVGGRSGNQLYNLPFMYLVDDRRLVPREDVFLRPPHAGRGFDVWNNNCIECHSVAGESNLDSSTGTFSTEVAELGITCEACHGPGHAHVASMRDPRTRYRHHRSDQPDPTIINPARLPAQAASHLCGQCHGMNVLKNDVFRAGQRYRAGGNLTDVKMILRTSDRALTELDRPDWQRLRNHLQRQTPTFIEERFWPDGMVRVSGREHNAMVESACFSTLQLSCLSCHSMHASPPRDQLASRMDGDDACLQCHASHAANIPAHTHHLAGSPGSACYNCHMPHTTYGLLKAIRSHLIDSPSVQASLDTGRPNACNLCHLDQPLSFAATHLHEWYGQPMPALAPEHETVSAAALWALRGDANQRALIAWHMGWEPAREISGWNWMTPYLSHLLADPYAAVRYIANRSLRRSPLFAALEYDFVASPQHQAAARDQALRLWRRQPALLDRSGERVLIDANGTLHASFQTHLDQRDDRNVDLRE